MSSLRSLAIRASLAALVCFSAVGCGDSAASDEPESEGALTLGTAKPLFVAPERPHVARYPIVFAHGFNGSASNSWSFNGVVDALKRDGDFAYAASVQPYNGSPERAATLVSELDTARKQFCATHAAADAQKCFEETKVNIVTHSQGGLDARYAISKLGYAAHVASLTTMGAPHRGTPLGDKTVAFLQSNVKNEITNALFELIGFTRTSGDLAADTNIKTAFFWLSEARANDPQYDMPDAPSVYYQSWAGVASLHDEPIDAGACDGKVFGERAGKFSLLLDAHFIPLIPVFTEARQRPNDGHIPVASAKWGNFRGCIPADHLDLLGRPDAQHGPDGEVARRTGFDHVAFYRVLADDLAVRGF